MYTLCVKKTRHSIVVLSTVLYRFLTFFHCCIQQSMSNKPLIIFPTTR